MSKPNTVTTTVMILTGGGTTTYGVYRAKLTNRNGKVSWNIHKAEHIASVTVKSGEKVDYLEIAKRYETPTYPAFGF